MPALTRLSDHQTCRGRPLQKPERTIRLSGRYAHTRRAAVELASLSSPPPAGTQIWPAMNPLTLVRVGCRIRVIGCRIRVISWWIVRRSITINDALIAHHQFPTAWVPRWKRADRDLCAGRRSAAQHCRSHSQSQNQPLHLSLPAGHPGTH